MGKEIGVGGSGTPDECTASGGVCLAVVNTCSVGPEDDLVVVGFADISRTSNIGTSTDSEEGGWCICWAWWLELCREVTVVWIGVDGFSD